MNQVTYKINFMDKSLHYQYKLYNTEVQKVLSTVPCNHAPPTPFITIHYRLLVPLVSSLLVIF